MQILLRMAVAGNMHETKQTNRNIQTHTTQTLLSRRYAIPETKKFKRVIVALWV